MILEAQRWDDNSKLIKAAFDLHVFPKKWARWTIDVLDPTYGQGIWWRWVEQATWLMPSGLTIIDDWGAHVSHSPITVTAHDIRSDGVDYRSLPYDANSFDVVAFDPDYVAPGGRKTSTITEFNDRYGLKDVYESPATLQASIDQGVHEAARVVKPQGIVLAKCMNYISSAKPWLGEKRTIDAGLAAGLKVEDIFVHLGDPGPQPAHKRQMHARSNSSRLIVFRKPGRRRKEPT